MLGISMVSECFDKQLIIDSLMPPHTDYAPNFPVRPSNDEEWWCWHNKEVSSGSSHVVEHFPDLLYS
jgi:hypothetical protein